MEELIYFRVNQTLGVQDYTEFSKKLAAVKMVRITYIILSVLLLGISVLMLALEQGATAIVWAIIAVSTIILLIRYPKIMGNNLFKNSQKVHNSNLFHGETVFCEEHIFDNSRNSSLTLEYSQFEKIIETNEHFFLMITKTTGLILRKDSFTQGDINQFRGFIASKSHIF